MLQHWFEEIGKVEFDKDDQDTLDFVTGASNIWAFNYHISLETPFKIKEIAGNIVPAVSSTNGLVGGLETSEAIKIVTKNFDQVWTINYSGLSFEKKKLYSTLASKEPWNHNCPVCSQKKLRVRVTVTREFTLNALLLKILKTLYSISTPIIQVGSTVLYEVGDDLDEDEVEEYSAKLDKPLCSLKISEGDILIIEDMVQDFKMDVEICFSEEEIEEGYKLHVIN